MSESTLAVQIVTSFEGLCALRAEWQALELVCGTSLPFQTWEWAVGWWRHLHEDRPGVRDALRVCVVRRASGEVVGIVPLMLTERPGVGPLRMRMLQFIGADPNITELRLMLCASGWQRDCYEAIASYLASMAEHWDWIEWDGLPAELAAEARVRDLMVGVEEKTAFVLDLPGTWAEFKKGLRRNIKQSLRHCYNSLEREGLSCRLEVLTKPEDILAALPNFFAFHAARANLDGTVVHSDVFASLPSRNFLVDVCDRFAQRGVARVFQLWVDDKLVAIRLGFALGDTLYLYYSGWDPQYARYGVMTTLLAEIIRCAIADGWTRVHLSMGKDVSKTRWGADEVHYIGGRQRSPRLKRRTLLFLYERLARARASKVARALAPAFLVRGTRAAARVAGPIPAEVSGRAG